MKTDANCQSHSPAHGSVNPQSGSPNCSKRGTVGTILSFTGVSYHFLTFSPNRILLYADLQVSVCSQECHGIYVWNWKWSSESLLGFMQWLCRPVKVFWLVCVLHARDQDASQVCLLPLLCYV